MDAFVSWFLKENGWLDKASMGLVDIPGQGRGAVAVQDIPEGHTLFTIPRSLTLSTRTSVLPRLLGDASWRSFQLNKGWVGLILCMMWEESRGSESKWSGYLEILPTAFDTPMFWSENELKELEGTAVLEKIGKEETEKDFREKLIPVVLSRPNLFNPAHLSSYYSLESYHRMGSRILSRSFHVERWLGEEVECTQEEAEVRQSYHSMDVDKIDAEEDEAEEGEAEEAWKWGEDSDGEYTEDPSDVAMVPMADMLNARYGSENAKLFYEPTELKMITTKPIKAGEQIYNTYGDPPNSGLLREYGHVDLVPFPTHANREGNPADIVEIRADLILQVVSASLGVDTDTFKERIEWWLEEGCDDTFVVGTNFELPDDLVSFFKLLLSLEDWERTRTKDKAPKPKLDQDAKLRILPYVLLVIESRMARYPTSLDHDEILLALSSTLSNKMRDALIVRLGEKRILAGCASKYKAILEEVKSTSFRSKGRSESGKAPMDQKKRKRGKGDADEEKTRKRSGR
ncbi:RMS1 [Sanghuangporus weigelae]